MIPQFNPLSSFYPLSLFANGEPGFWLDPSDLSTMYQNVAGTTPVTAVEQPVGLILDKSKGLVLGAELITVAADRNFTSDTGFWTKSEGTITISGNALNFAATGSGQGAYSSAIIGQSGYYQITVTVASISGQLNFYLAGNVTTVITSPGTYVINAFSGTAAALFTIRANAAGLTASVTSISVKKIAGTHYYQSTAGVRPVLSARVNLLTKTEFPSGVSDLVFKTALVTSSTLSGYAGAVAFGFDGVADAIGYKNIATAATSHTLSVVVSMDDGNAPVFGSATGSAATNTFMFVLAGNGTAPTSNTVTSLGGGLYRVSIAVTGNVSATNFGILKYHTNDSRTFKTTAWDIRPTDQFNALISQYQYVNTSTDYTTAGFPLYLSGNGTQWMQCAAQDYTGVNKMLVCAGNRTTGSAVAVLWEQSASSSANNGAVGYIYYNTAYPSREQLIARGTAVFSCNDNAAPAAPVSAVTTSQVNISTDFGNIRRNGVSVATATGTLGGGNFGNYAAYIFARAGSSLFFTGNLYQLIARGSTVASNAAQISAAESWTDLKTKAY